MLQARSVGGSQYETLQPRVVDEDTGPLLSFDYDGRWLVLRDGRLKVEIARVDDCLTCVEQSGPEIQCRDPSDDRVRTVAEVTHYDRVIIEWCCGHDSLLGRTSKYSKGCKVERLTIDVDLRTLAGLQQALQIVKPCPKGRTLLWSATRWWESIANAKHNSRKRS
jgi:hypothetical protein